MESDPQGLSYCDHHDGCSNILYAVVLHLKVIENYLHDLCFFCFRLEKVGLLGKERGEIS